MTQPETPDKATPSPAILHGFASMTLLPAVGEVEVRSVDGQVGTVRGLPLLPAQVTVKASFFPDVYAVELLLHDGEVIRLEVGTGAAKIDSPVAYLDQNIWIDLARVQAGSTKALRPERVASCEKLIGLAEDRKVILPISAAHAVETTKVFGQRRSNLARTMLRLSRGWQMRSPLQLRQEELQRLFTPVSAVLVPQADVFTLEPNALWSEGRSRVVRIPRSATAVDGFVERLSWSVGLTEMLLSEEQSRSEGGASIASRWAASFQELAQYLPTNPKAKEKLRDLSRFRFITDMQDDAVRAASFCGLAPEEYVAWLSEGSEDALHLAPALGRIREVLHLRLSNPDDKWEANDLNDLMYLASAAGYSDFVVCERKTANQLHQVESRVPRGAKVFRRLEDLMAQIGEGAG